MAELNPNAPSVGRLAGAALHIQRRWEGRISCPGDLVSRCGDLTPRPAAEEGEGLSVTRRSAPKSCLQILVVSEKHPEWNVQE